MVDTRKALYLLLTWVTLILLTGALAGWLAGNTWLGMFLGSACLLFWHHLNLRALIHHLWLDRKLVPPKGRGPWAIVFDGIYRLRRQHRTRLRRLIQLSAGFRDGMESLPYGVLLFSSEQTILWANRDAQRLLGLKWPGDRGQRIDNLLRLPAQVRFFSEPEINNPRVLPSSVNPEILLEYRLVRYRGQQQILTISDVTRLYKLEAMRRDLVADVSHELRTPLTVLQGYIEILEEQATNPLQDSALTVMGGQIQRMSRLVAQLSALSSIEGSQGEVTREVIDVHALLAEIEVEARALAADKSLDLRFSIDPSRGVRGNREQLRSAFSNLVFNSIRFTPENGCIQVNWKPVIDGMAFEVIDNGVGIAAQHLPRITERFYRVDKSRSAEHGGSGLGLAIVKHALNHHDTQLEVESEIGQGSCFRFVLPEARLVSSNECQPGE